MKVEVIVHNQKQVQLYRVLHWWEYGRIPDFSTPEVNRLDPFDQFLMTEAWQWFMFGLLEIQAGGSMTHDQLVQAFSSLYAGATAFCNGNGVDTHANYISGEIGTPAHPLPLPGFFPIICGGNVLTGEEVTIKGIQYLQVEHLSGNPPDLDDVNRNNYPWLIQLSTIITTKKLADGSYQVIRFPQMRGRDVPVPILAKEDVTYPLSKLQRLPMGAAVPSPYYP